MSFVARMACYYTIIFLSKNDRKTQEHSALPETPVFPVVRLPASIRSATIKREKDEYDDESAEEETMNNSARKGKAKKEDDDEYKFEEATAQEDVDEEEDDESLEVKKPLATARSSRLKISDLCSPQEDEEE